MGFHEVSFPTDISYGSIGGPGFMTNIIELDSGKEQRVARWNQARHRYNVAYGVKSYDQLYALIDFYIARRGVANGFRFKDFTDCTSAPADGFATELGGTEVTATDQLLGIGDATTNIFQLRKLYGAAVAGPYTRWRLIEKPVTGTVKVAVDGNDLGAVGTGWTVDVINGEIFIDNAPQNGHDIEAGFEFEVPVRFGTEVDEMLSLDIESFGQGSSQDIPLVELVLGSELEDEFFYGGAISLAPSAETLINKLEARVIELNPSVDNVGVRLPAITVGGGPFFYIINKHATNTVKIKDSDGNIILSLGPQGFATFVSHYDASIPQQTWYGFA